MATVSTRWGFTLPDPADTVDVTKLVADFVTIDNALGMTPCLLGTRPSSPSSGQAIYETDTHQTYVWDTSGATGVWQPLAPLLANVVSDVPANTDGTATQVGDLTITVQPGTYALDAFIVYSSATAADAVLSFSLPNGSTVLFSEGGLDVTGTGYSLAVTTTASITLGGAGVGALLAAQLKGTITTGVNQGNVVASWAQAVATASATVLKAGSWMRLQRC